MSTKNKEDKVSAKPKITITDIDPSGDYPGFLVCINGKHYHYNSDSGDASIMEVLKVLFTDLGYQVTCE